MNYKLGFPNSFWFSLLATMKQQLGQIAILVRDYDEAIEYYTNVLGFELIEDTHISDIKRFQSGGRVFLFLYTDNFYRDYHNYTSKGIEFIREPSEEAFGTVSVFKDLYGNLWDFIERK